MGTWGRFFISRRDELLRCVLCGSAGVCDLGRYSWFMRSWSSFCFCSCSCDCSSVIRGLVHVHVLCSWLHPLPVSHNSHPNPACISHTTQPPTAKHAQAPISIPSSCDQAHIEQTPRAVSAGRAPMPDRCQSTCLSARCWDGRHPIAVATVAGAYS